MHGLIIREPWIGFILNGSKTWEMRTTAVARRGRIGLIRKGTGLVVGVADLLDCLPPLDRAALGATRDRHRIPAELDNQVLEAGWVHPWVLGNVRALPRPVVAGQKSGQVIWVPIPDESLAAIEAQLGQAALPAASANTREPEPTPIPAAVTSPRRYPPIEGGRFDNGRDTAIVSLTAGAIRNSNITVRNALHLLRDTAIGGPNRRAAAARGLTIIFEPGETVETDVAGDKMLLRCRGAVSDFFARSGARAGDQVEFRRQGDGAFRVRILPR